jgi:hypothetical protein
MSSPPPSDVKQKVLLVNESRVRAFSEGALTEEYSGPPPPQPTLAVVILSALNIYLIHRGGRKREHLA